MLAPARMGKPATGMALKGLIQMNNPTLLSIAAGLVLAANGSAAIINVPS